MLISKSSISTLSQLKSVIDQLTDEEYTSTLDVFSGAHIGQHTRHILEFYSCVLNGSKEICYDDRKRDLEIETSVEKTSRQIDFYIDKLNAVVSDQNISLRARISSDAQDHIYQSTLSRELLYLYEHSIHHMAIIKIGLMLNFPKIEIPVNFGVADSTVRYKESQCAQ